eukprot:CFRG0487T1
MAMKPDLGRRRSRSVGDLTKAIGDCSGSSLAASLLDIDDDEDKNMLATPEAYSAQKLKLLDSLQDEMDEFEIPEEKLKSTHVQAKSKPKKSVPKKKKTEKKGLTFHDCNPTRKRPVENRVSRANEKKRPTIRVRSNSVSALADRINSQQAPPRSDVLQWHTDIDNIALGLSLDTGFSGMDSSAGLFSSPRRTSVHQHTPTQQFINTHDAIMRNQMSGQTNNPYNMIGMGGVGGGGGGSTHSPHPNSQFNAPMDIRNSITSVGAGGVDLRNSLAMGGIDMRNNIGMNRPISPINRGLNAGMNAPANMTMIGNMYNATGTTNSTTNTNTLNNTNAVFQSLPTDMTGLSLNGMSYDNIMQRQTQAPNVFVTPDTQAVMNNNNANSYDTISNVSDGPVSSSFGSQGNIQGSISNSSKPELNRTSGKTLSTVFRELLDDREFIPTRAHQQNQNQNQAQPQNQNQNQNQPLTQTQSHNQNHNQNQNQNQDQNHIQFQIQRQTQQEQQEEQFSSQQNRQSCQSTGQSSPIQGLRRPSPQSPTDLNTNTNINNLNNLANTTINNPNLGISLPLEDLDATQAQLECRVLPLSLPKPNASHMVSVTGLRLPSDIMRVMDTEFGSTHNTGNGVSLGVGGGVRGSMDSVKTDNDDFLDFLDRESNALPR